MKATVHQTVCTLLAALSLVLPANSHAQTNPPKLEISACACRGPDPGHGPLSIGAEYRITLFVTNTGASEIFFQEVQGAFGAARGGVLTQRTTGRKETMTLKPGQGQVYFFPTDSYTSELLANSGSASLLFQATFLDEHSNVLASSEATLPRLKELPLANSFCRFLPTPS